MSPDDMTVAVVDETVDPIESMTDRELLEYIAKTNREAVRLISEGVSALGPLLDNPKL